MEIAVLLSSFNRREKTYKCLHSLFQILPNCDVYLTDDNSTDGTAEMVKEYFPQVHLLKGDGNLFWSRGMYTAWKEAVKKDYDYYIWLNDDVELYPNFWTQLIESQKITNSDCIITGLIENKKNEGEIIYGGSDFNKNLIRENTFPSKVKFMNGNVVLIPQSVTKRIGILDPTFHHDLGDVDYGLSALENNIPVYATKVAVAAGYPNGFCRVRKWNTNIAGRFRKLNSPLGSPIGINFYFRKKHFGIFNAMAYSIFLVILNTVPDWFVVLLWKDTYKDKIISS